MGLGIGAYGLWGLFPLYWPLLKPASAGEILASRMTWSLAAMVVILAVRRMPAGTARWGWIRPLVRSRRRMLLLTVAAFSVTVNWLVYIWAVNAGHVVDASLGYFINPLVSVLFGVLVLREKLRRTQWAAVGIGALSVLVLAVGYGKLPWIALTLAISFGTYGLVKKLAAVPAAESMAIETSILFLPALGYLIWLGTHDSLAFGHHSGGNTALLALAGPVTVIPLIMFAGAANRLPLSLVGLLQFLTPVLQFLCGVLVQHESAPPARLAGFLIVWIALAILTVDALRAGRPVQVQAAATPGPVAARAVAVAAPQE